MSYFLFILAMLFFIIAIWLWVFSTKHASIFKLSDDGFHINFKKQPLFKLVVIKIGKFLLILFFLFLYLVWLLLQLILSGLPAAIFSYLLSLLFSLLIYIYSHKIILIELILSVIATIIFIYLLIRYHIYVLIQSFTTRVAKSLRYIYVLIQSFTTRVAKSLRLHRGDNIQEAVIEAIYLTYTYEGDARLPKRVYVGDSDNISVNLMRIISSLPPYGYLMSQKDEPTLKLLCQIENDRSFEIELQLEKPETFTVVGEKKISHPLRFEKTTNLPFRWNCCFPKSGNQKVSLNFNLVNPIETLKSSAKSLFRTDNQKVSLNFNLVTPIETKELGTISQTIRVGQLANLTLRQVQIIRSVVLVCGAKWIRGPEKPMEVQQLLA